MGLKIIETAKYLPEKVVANTYFENRMDTSDAWISERTGIRTRHFAEEMTNLQMIKNACKKLMQLENIRLIIVASFHVESIMPSASCILQQYLSLYENILAIDVNVACTGFVSATILAEKYLQPGERALIVGAEKFSSVLDFNDRSTAILFGDGAGAVVYEKTETKFSFDTGTRGNMEDLTLLDDAYLKMNGKKIFRFAVTQLPRSIEMVLKKSTLQISEIDFFVMHQANLRILNHVGEKLQIPKDKIPVNVNSVGNIGAASVAILLDKIDWKNKKLVLSGFGAGLSWASCVVEG